MTDAMTELRQLRAEHEAENRQRVVELRLDLLHAHKLLIEAEEHLDPDRHADLLRRIDHALWGDEG